MSNGVVNEQGEVELRFGHHRLQAALEFLGPDYEAAVEIVPFQGEWSLLRALRLENSINRNKVSHLHEVVTQLVHWWDDVVFEQFPTWEACECSAIFSRSQLEYFFGSPDGGGGGGLGMYAKSAKYGIGREVLAKMLEGTESRSAIEEALRNLPMTARRKRGIEQQIEEARQEAEALRAEADRIEAEREAACRPTRARERPWLI